MVCINVFIPSFCVCVVLATLGFSEHSEQKLMVDGSKAFDVVATELFLFGDALGFRVAKGRFEIQEHPGCSRDTHF